jgi:hypothetical protein
MEDVLKVVSKDVQTAIGDFRKEVRLAKNVETLELVKRVMWDGLLSEGGCYYDLCKRCPMLNVLRLNAYIRYCDVLKKVRIVDQDVNMFIVVNRVVCSYVVKPCVLVDVFDDELVINDISY